MPHPPAPVRVLGTSTTLRCEKAEPTVALAVGPARHRGGRVTVIDAWQGRRLGSALAARLSERALEAGIEYPPPKSAPRTGPCSRCCPAWGQVETEQGGPVIAARRKPHGPAQTAATTSADGALHYRATSASSRRSSRQTSATGPGSPGRSAPSTASPAAAPPSPWARSSPAGRMPCSASPPAPGADPHDPGPGPEQPALSL